MTNFIETEIKIYVADLYEMARRIEAAGGEAHSERIFERNVRYEDVGETLTPAKRVLRLRQDTRARLTYKEPVGSDDDGMTRTELEVTVSDFETMDLLLRKIGFHPAWIYEKYRTTYGLGGCEIVLDETPMGNFIEIEGEPGAIDQVVEQLGLASRRRITASYSELFFQMRDRLGLSIRDLTFENFRDVRVPSAWFEGGA